MKLKLFIFLACLSLILLISSFAKIPTAYSCPPYPPCPPCHSGCECHYYPNCGSSCCQGDQGCCDDKKCYNPDTEQCCGNGDGKTCPNDKSCCGSSCCGPGESCCDGECCPSGRECCNGTCCASGKTCCGGSCCSPEECCNGECCPPGETCCGGVCCGDPDKCESCGDFGCEVCGGDPDKICCSGDCKSPCENTAPTGACDTSQSRACIGCTVGTYTCSGFTTTIYTGNIAHSCTGGCPGDCEDKPEVLCYTEFWCERGTTMSLSICTSAGENTACENYYGDVWFCTPCVPSINTTGNTHFVPHKACK